VSVGKVATVTGVRKMPWLKTNDPFKVIFVPSGCVMCWFWIGFWKTTKKPGGGAGSEQGCAVAGLNVVPLVRQ